MDIKRRRRRRNGRVLWPSFYTYLEALVTDDDELALIPPSLY